MACLERATMYGLLSQPQCSVRRTGAIFYMYVAASSSGRGSESIRRTLGLSGDGLGDREEDQAGESEGLESVHAGV
jgi:hypothetical protein